MPRKKKIETAEITMITRVEVDVRFGHSALEKIFQFLNMAHVGQPTLPLDRYPNESSVPVELVKAQRNVAVTHRIYIEVSVDKNGNLSYKIV
jgi:hypothetical protein